MTTDDQQDFIDKYILGDDATRRKMADTLAADPALAKELEATSTAVAAIELAEDRALKNRLRGIETSLSDTGRKPETKVVPMRKKNSSRNWLAIAATVLFLVVAGLFLLKPDPAPNTTELAMAEFEAYPNIAYSITKGDNQTTEAEAYIAYEAGDYATAEQLFSQLPATEVSKFYLAQSQLAQRKFTAAQPLFTQLADKADFNLSQEAAYYAAVAKLGQGQQEAARRELQAIADQRLHPSRREALNLLSKIE